MTRIGIIGSQGRMGQALQDAIADAGHDYAGGVDQGGDPGELSSKADLLVDFSAPGALEANLAAARQAGIPIVIGTTGLEDTHHALIDDAAGDIAVLQTGNTSLGVTLLAHLAEQAASKLGPDWDIEIVEMHHRMKVDAPSGTALLLGGQQPGAAALTCPQIPNAGAMDIPANAPKVRSGLPHCAAGPWPGITA